MEKGEGHPLPSSGGNGEQPLARFTFNLTMAALGTRHFVLPESDTPSLAER